MPADPRVSIILPVYNAGRLLDEAVDSVVAQTFPHWELVVGDNGSTDGSVDRVAARGDPRIRILRHPRNLGIFGNLQALTEAARCEEVKILCGDDRLEPRCLEVLVDGFARHPTAGVFRNWYTSNAGPVRAASRRLGRNLPPWIPPEAAALPYFALGNLVGSLTNGSFRKSSLLGVGGWEQQMPNAGDYATFARVALRSGMVVVPDELVFVRDHPNRASTYLNRSGQIVSQLMVLRDTLYDALDPADRALARRVGTLLAGYAAVSCLRKGRKAWPGLRAVASARHHAGVGAALLAYGTSWAGRREPVGLFAEVVARTAARSAGRPGTRLAEGASVGA